MPRHGAVNTLDPLLTVTRLSVCLMLWSACGAEGTLGAVDHPPRGVVIETGRLQNAAISEASGLALSLRNEDHLWTINDGGSPPVLYAFGHDGSEQGSIRLLQANNVDWEDLASFEFNGRPSLLIADVGDNLAARDHVTLYIVEEPDLSKPDATPSKQISFRYPDGPRDAEAIAVDTDEQLAYVLSKRLNPAQLYSIPLGPAASVENDVVTATYLGTVASIPQPTPEDLDRALAETNWHWQVTAMDFFADGKRAVILTYRAVYLYDRQTGESWLEALQRSPTAFPLGNIREAEAVSLSRDSIFVTVEALHAPLYRIRYR